MGHRAVLWWSWQCVWSVFWISYTHSKWVQKAVFIWCHAHRLNLVPCTSFESGAMHIVWIWCHAHRLNLLPCTSFESGAMHIVWIWCIEHRLNLVTNEVMNFRIGNITVVVVIVVVVEDTIFSWALWYRVLQLNWLHFCGICQLIPLKIGRTQHKAATINWMLYRYQKHAWPPRRVAYIHEWSILQTSLLSISVLKTSFAIICKWNVQTTRWNSKLQSLQYNVMARCSEILTSALSELAESSLSDSQTVAATFGLLKRKTY